MRSLGSIALVAVLLGTTACEVNSSGNEGAANQNEVAQTGSAGNMAETVNQTGSGGTSQDDPESVARAQQLAASLAPEAERAKTRQQAAAETQGLRLVVDQSDREVRIFRGDRLIGRHPVAVGTDENPTPIGEFAFHRVDLNPRWVPPDSDWAEDREPKEPGAPDNPMGRARLVYQMPYTIHGTDSLDSLGKAVSHGSIRLANENVIPLAEMMLKAGNSWEGQSWFQQMVQNRDKEFQVPLQQDIPLKIQE